MYWNYRVMKRVVDGDTFYGIYEVTYDTNNKEPALWDENATIEEESIERLIEELVDMLGACYKDVLDHDATPAGSRELDEALSEAMNEMKEVGWDGLEKFPIKEDKFDNDEQVELLGEEK